MKKKAKWFILAGIAILAAAVTFVNWQFFAPAPLPPPETPTGPMEGLSWLPAESGLVAHVDLASVRQYEWLMNLLDKTSQNATVEEDYRRFVESTGFDYTRDLDSLWLALYGPEDNPHAAGVAVARFSSAKITAHALAYGGRKQSYRQYEIYQVDNPVRSRADVQGSFAFAFATDTRLAFGSDAVQVQHVLDCAHHRYDCIADDALRRQRLEEIAGEQQLWIADDLSRWVPPYLRNNTSAVTLLQDVAAGLRVSPDGLRIRTFGRCHEPSQAKSLHDNLKVLLLFGKQWLGNSAEPVSRAAAEHLAEVQLYQQDSDLQAELTLSPEQVRQLLQSPNKTTGRTPKP